MDKILEIKNLKKSYGHMEVLKDVNLTLEAGKVLGIIGPNGSGKTTLLKSIMGLIKPDSGQILVDGNEIGIKTKKIISFLPDCYHLYENLTIEDAINLYKDFYDDFNTKVCEDLFNFMQIPKKGYAEKLSKGMKEKLLLALTLSRDTKLYILDEPVDGVDPLAKDIILNAIIKTIKTGRTIILTTHQIRDLENLFDQVAFFRDGQVLFKEDAETIRDKYHMQISEFYKDIFA
ncbi:MAG: ABC transporter ATP-binding protein [Peptoniphilaceae bacterium]|nr:ABC transporter ATP-binding protein [Peptoniphilaceae bacterium]MDY6019316.1 ABC transporter ATP-binding protein [Anaerococcus sp.]